MRMTADEMDRIFDAIVDHLRARHALEDFLPGKTLEIDWAAARNAALDAAEDDSAPSSGWVDDQIERALLRLQEDAKNPKNLRAFITLTSTRGTVYNYTVDGAEAAGVGRQLGEGDDWLVFTTVERVLEAWPRASVEHLEVSNARPD